MNILLLGSGGREHALAWKLTQSKFCTQLFIAPGNTGTAQHGTNLPFSGTDFETIKTTCLERNIELVVIGPEEPLVKGLVNYLKNDPSLQHLLVIGPSQEAAQLEGSKAYAKAFMQRHGIPTAAYREFTTENFSEGVEYLHRHTLPIVLKADGLAAGKGVIISQNHVEAITEFELMTQHAKFGEAGKRVVVEEYLDGIELSVFVLTDGQNYVVLPEAKDYKRIGEGDTGLNTGGMGAVSPVPFADDAFMQKVITEIVEPTVKGLQKDNLYYKGFIFIGLMKIGDEPYVIEYNCRMGDPETEVVMPRLTSDLVELLKATASGKLAGITIEKDPRFATAIMAVSGGYPNEFKKGLPITGLKEYQPKEDVLVFHAGTKDKEGTIVTNGGRILCVTALADSIEAAVSKARTVLDTINYENKYYRSDIGYEFVGVSSE